MGMLRLSIFLPILSLILSNCAFSPSFVFAQKDAFVAQGNVLRRHMQQQKYGPTKIVLSGDPLVTIEYMILSEQNSVGKLPPAVVEAGGMLVVRMKYEGEGWISFGSSPTGTMIGGEVVIGKPKSIETKPKKYYMTSLQMFGIVEMPDEQQTLIDAYVKQEDGITVMEFGKLLNETGEHAINPGTKHTFIWPVGSSNALFHHSLRNSFTVDLTHGMEGASVMFGSSEAPNKTLWIAHGVFALIAWGVFGPIAAASSLLRLYLPSESGMWYKLHLYLNLLCVVFTIISFGLAVGATASDPSLSGSKQRKHFVNLHEVMGLAIFAICLFQVLNGYLRPSMYKKNSHDQLGGTVFSSSKDNSSVNDNSSDATTNKTKEDAVDKNNVNNNNNDIEQLSNNEDMVESSTPQKTIARLFFEIGHRIIGSVLLVLSALNIISGLKLYAIRYYVDNNWTIIAFWSYIGTLLVIVLSLKLMSRFRIHSSN